MIRPVPERRSGLDVAWFHEIVRKIFLHRRKNLRHVLTNMWSSQWTKADADIWLKSLGLDGQVRAEALAVEQFRILADALKMRWGSESAQLAGEEAEGE